MKQPPGWSRYYRVVARVPRGRVATYGQIAMMAGQPRCARQVGYALAALHGTESRLPWHRVLGKRPGGYAGISLLDPMGAAAQRALLEREGIEVDDRERVSLERFGWRPARRRRPDDPVQRPARRPAPAKRASARPSRSPRRTAGWSDRS